jgi:indoleamine 2,3-dioxygenase
LTAILQRVHESCDTTVFYHRIRPFLAGSKNMAEAGLPNGVMYEDAAGNVEYRQYSGGSNAQSSLIQFFDIALGIEHRPTGDKGGAGPPPGSADHSQSPKHNFLIEMRDYMPEDHARFLGDVSKVANIRAFVESRTEDTDLCLAYDACLAMLSAFRDRHIAIVTRYIVLKAREARARNRSRSPQAMRQRVNIATSSAKSQRRGSSNENQEPSGNKLTGTGGTSLLPFLKQARDETGEPAIAEWMQGFMNRKMKAERVPSELLKTQEPELPPQPEPSDGATAGINGLAGAWAMDDEVGGGGICNY